MKWALSSKGKANGFTLVELLIVIVIIGILAAITIIAYNGITTKARTTVLQSDLSQDRTTLAAVNAENGAYPADQPSAVSAGLKASSGDTLTYVLNGDGYCLQASGWSQTYYVTDQISQATSGSCPTLPSIAFEGYSNGNQPGNGNTVIFTAPSGTQAGDLLIAFVRSDSGTATPPSGWTMDATDTSGGSGFDVARYHKYATGSDIGGTTYTFTGPGLYAWGEMAQLRPLNSPSNPTNDPFAVAGSHANTPATVSLGATTAPGILIVWAAEVGEDTGFSFSSSPSATMTKVGDANGSALSWAQVSGSTAYTVTAVVPDNSAMTMAGIVTGL